MKNIILFILTFIIFLSGCKEKKSHDKALAYFVSVSLQVKEVTNLVKNFSPQFSKILKDTLVKNKAVEIDSLQKNFSYLLTQINQRLGILDKLEPYNKELIIKLWATYYIKDIKRILFSVSDVINVNRNTSDKRQRISRMNMYFDKKTLEFDDSNFRKYSTHYIRKYNISDFDLSKYALK